MNKQKGITLIEVLITLLITTVGLLGLAALQLGALQATADSGQRGQAVWLMQDLIERMRANPRATDANYQQTVNCNSVPKQCAHSPSAAALECSASEMAHFDLWEAQCPYGNGTNVFNSRDSLVAAEGQDSIVILNAVTNGFTATASWFYKGAANHATSGIDIEQEIRR